VKYLSILLVP